MSVIGSQLPRLFLTLVAVAFGTALLSVSADVLAVTSHPFAIAEQRLSTGSTGWFAEFFAQMAKEWGFILWQTGHPDYADQWVPSICSRWTPDGDAGRSGDDAPAPR